MLIYIQKVIQRNVFYVTVFNWSPLKKLLFLTLQINAWGKESYRLLQGWRSWVRFEFNIVESARIPIHLRGGQFECEPKREKKWNWDSYNKNKIIFSLSSKDSIWKFLTEYFALFAHNLYESFDFTFCRWIFIMC